MQLGYFLQKTLEHTGRTQMNGDDKCNALEEWMAASASQGGWDFLIWETLSIRIHHCCHLLISGQKAKCLFTWALKWEKQRGKRQPLDLVFFSVCKAMATLRVGYAERRPWINFQLCLIPRHTFNQHNSPQHLTLISDAKRDALHLNLNNCFCILLAN